MGEKYSYDGKNGKEIFKDILDEKVGRFPIGFWKQSGVEYEAAEITRYFIEDILKWEDKDIREKICEMIFRKYHLSGMLEYVFGRSPFRAIDNAYPGRYKVWELTCTPKHFWEDKKNRENALHYLLNKTGKARTDELSNVDFLNYGLGGLMDYLSKYNAFILLEDKKESRIYKNVSFFTSNNQSSRNLIRATIELPVSMFKEIGVSKTDNNVMVSVKDGKIIIEKSGELPTT